MAEQFRREGRLGSNQFFIRGKNDPGAVIRTIAFDLAHSNSAVAAAVITAATSNDLISAPLPTQFSELLLKPLLNYGQEDNEPMIVVLDALDESAWHRDSCQTPKLGAMDGSWFVRRTTL